jgi:hypothetical protein
VWVFRGSASGGGTVTNPLTSNLVATGFAVLNQSGNAPEQNSIRLGGTRVFNIINTDLTEVFKVDANANVSVGSTGSVATLTVGNASATEGITIVSVQDLNGLAEMGPSGLNFSYTDSRVINLTNNSAPQIQLVDSTNLYTANLCSGNDEITSGLTLTTPNGYANYTNASFSCGVNASLRAILGSPYGLLIQNDGNASSTVKNSVETTAEYVLVKSEKSSVTAKNTYIRLDTSTSTEPTLTVRNNGTATQTTITDTSVTSASFVGTLTGSASKMATGALAVAAGSTTTLTLAQLGYIVTVTGSSSTSIILPTGAGVAIGNYYTIVNASTSSNVNVYQSSATALNLLKTLTHAYTVTNPLLTTGVIMIWTGSIWASTGGIS